MARYYSVDLPERMLRVHEPGKGSHRVLAERFAVNAAPTSQGTGNKAASTGGRKC